VSRADRVELRPGEIVRRLAERNVDFVVIGGVAAVLHGSARDTFDLDVSYATNDANLAALGDVLTSLGARLKGVEDDVPFVADSRTLRQMEVLTMVTDLGELDVLAKPSGAPAYETLRARAERYELDGFSVLVASIEDLLAMKRSAGRPKDVADVAELEAIARLRRQQR
jgi:predicted nucleotidyltransferase